jgi:hypothetical protein
MFKLVRSFSLFSLKQQFWRKFSKNLYFREHFRKNSTKVSIISPTQRKERLYVVSIYISYTEIRKT